MKQDEDWDLIARSRSPLFSLGSGVVRFALLFGSAAIALALLIVPMLERAGTSNTRQAGWAGVDTMATGSIAPSGPSYVVRRSVLQKSPSAVCIIAQNGARRGDC